jgi:hypothetical protein
MERTQAPAPPWVQQLGPLQATKASILPLLAQEVGPLVDARLASSSAVPPFKPPKVSYPFSLFGLDAVATYHSLWLLCGLVPASSLLTGLI